MDIRFLAAGILAAALGYVSGATVFAAAPRPALDPGLAQAARDRTAMAAEVAAPLPPSAELPELPDLPPPPKLPDVNAVAKVAPRVRVVVVRRRTTGATTHTTNRRPARRHEHEREHEHEGSDHERGDD